jgi:hypothetical protein
MIPKTIVEHDKSGLEMVLDAMDELLEEKFIEGIKSKHHNAYEIEQSQKRWESICIKAEIEASKGIWRTKDGRVLKVEEMETGHIKNCMRMLERNNVPIRKPYIVMFTKELHRRGEQNED